MANTNNNEKITKELRKTVISLIKDTIKYRESRKGLIRQVKKLDYNQPEKKLAYLLLNNNLMRVYVRAFYGLKRPNYFLQWLDDDYTHFANLTEATTKMFRTIHSSHNEEVALTDGQVLEDMIDTVTNGQIAVLKQKKMLHDKLIEQYEMEVKLYLLDTKAHLERLEERIKEEKTKLEKYLE